MKLLLDAGLPTHAEALSTPDCVLTRWRGPDVPDSSLIEQARNDGYRGVVFLSGQSLARRSLLQAAKEHEVALVIIDTEDPVRAARYLDTHLARVQVLLRDHSLLLVKARAILTDVESVATGDAVEAIRPRLTEREEPV